MDATENNSRGRRRGPPPAFWVKVSLALSVVRSYSPASSVVCVLSESLLSRRGYFAHEGVIPASFSSGAPLRPPRSRWPHRVLH